jgi:hypothetical protein
MRSTPSEVRIIGVNDMLFDAYALAKRIARVSLV